METTLTAKVLTGKKEFRTIFDKEKNMLIVQTTQKPQDNKANKEILKELKKFFKTEIKIVFVFCFILMNFINNFKDYIFLIYQ